MREPSAQGKPMGRPKTITNEYILHLKELVGHSPKTYGYPFSRWTAAWLGFHLAKELGIEVSDRHINRLLQRMGLSTRRLNTVSVETKSIESNSHFSRRGRICIQDLNPSECPEFHWPLS
jgi:transposase